MKLEIEIPDIEVIVASQKIARDAFRGPYSSEGKGGPGYEAIRKTVEQAVANYDFAEKVLAEIERILPEVVAETAKVEAGKIARKRLKERGVG